MFQTVSRLLSKLQLNSELGDFTKHAVTTGLQLTQLVGKVLGFLVTNKPDKNASLASITHPHTDTLTHTHSLTHSLVTNAQFLHVSTLVMPSLSGEGQLLRYYLRYCYVIPPFLSLNQQSQRTGAKKTQVRTQVFN